jgi:hypothetical protein
MLVQVHQGGLHILKGGKEMSHAHSKMNKNIKAAAICSAQIALILTDATLVLCGLKLLVYAALSYECMRP